MWLHDPGAARAAGQPVTGPVIDATGVTVPLPDGPPAAPLDVEALLFGRGTVYLLGAEDAQLAPLLTALTGHIARTGRQVAGRQPDGRLDPPATFALDEAAIICLIPLDKWTSDFGGRNMPMHILVQSSAQLAQRWGQHGGAAITNNAGAVVIFGGTKDEQDLRAHSMLIGDREERVITRDHHGKVISETTHRVPIFSPAQLAQLPPFRVVVIRRGLPPVIGKTERYWKRADYRAVQRADRREKRAQVWARRRQAAAHHWAELKAAVAELVDTAADLARQLREQYQQAAARRAQRRAQQAEAERVAHESIDPQPAGPDRHEPAPQTATARTRTARAVTAMTDTVTRPSWLSHPILAWRAYQAALAERADADAVAAGLTVQVLPNGVRRYRHAHLDQALAAYRARHTTPTRRPVHRRGGALGLVTGPTRHHRGRPGVVAVSPQRLRRIAVGVCLDCAANLHVDEATGALVDQWGQATCGATYRAHAPDLPPVAAEPAAPATSMTDRLRRAAPLAGAGAVPPPTVPHQGRCAGSASLRDHLPVALDPGHPAAVVSGAPRAGAQNTAPARLPSGPANNTPGGAR